MLPQERIAWVWIIASMVVFTTYFTTLWVMQQDSANLSFLTRISLLGVALITFAVVVGGDRAIAVLRGQGQTDDERDRLIRLQAVSVAYYVLMAGAIVVGCVMPFSHSGWDIVHAAVLAVVLSEVVRGAVVVLGYRRGYH